MRYNCDKNVISLILIFKLVNDNFVAIEMNNNMESKNQQKIIPNIIENDSFVCLKYTIFMTQRAVIYLPLTI